MKKLICFIVLVIAAALVLTLFAACSGGEAESETGSVVTSAPSGNESGNETDTSDIDTLSPGGTAMYDDGKTIPVETPYGDLLFPESLSDALDYEIEDDGEGSCRVSFFALLNERRYPLYDISIGSGEGEAVGTLTGPDGTARDVYLSVHENDLSGVPEDERTSVYAMQETLNDVISNLD